MQFHIEWHIKLILSFTYSYTDDKLVYLAFNLLIIFIAFIYIMYFSLYVFHIHSFNMVWA